MWSAEYMREITGSLYFWTFTFRRVHHAWHYPQLWHAFMESLENVCPEDTYGIRVVEMHDGENGRGHGFHYHVLLNRWVDARRVWRLCKQHEMGCDAQKVRQKDWQNSVKYLTKYLTKDAAPFPICPRRVGGMFGMPMERKRDIRFIHPHSDSVSYLTRLWGRGAFGSDVVGRIYDSPNCAGDYKTLIVGLEYKNERKCDVFNWPERYFDMALTRSPY